MSRTRIFFSGCSFCLCLLLIVSMLSACGMERLAAPLPDLEELSLAELESIQNDPRLTDDEKRQAIRDTIGAPADESGDRLVEFLLNFDVP